MWLRIAWLFVFALASVGNASPKTEGIKILTDEKRIELAGSVSTELERYRDELKGSIEYLACCEAGKAYESLIVLKADPQAIYDALVKLGSKPGEPAYDDEEGKHVLPKGDPIRLWVRWQAGGKTKEVRAESLVLRRKTGKPLKKMDWIFTGSRLTWPLDEDSEEQILEATLLKNIVALHHADPSVLIQNPLAEAAEDNLYEKNAKLLPPPGTPVTLIMQIQPKKEKQDAR